MLWLISIISLWINPVIGFFLIRLTKKRLDIRQRMVRVFGSLTFLILARIATKISTPLIEIDWCFLGIFHLSICFFIWLGWNNKRLLIMIASLIIMIPIFTVGYLLSTIGLLGLGFITA